MSILDQVLQNFRYMHTCLESVGGRLAFEESGERRRTGLTVSGEQRDRSTRRSSTTSTTDTMNVVFRVVGIVIIEDMSNVLDIFNRVSIQQK